MASFNKVMMMGNLTRDPELRYTPNGAAVATLGLAVNRKYKQGEEWKEEVCFIDITVWGKQAENCAEYLAKGRSVFVEGHLKMNTWETDGQKRTKHEVVANTVQFLSRAGGPDQGGSGKSSDGYSQESPSKDDVPF